MEIVAGFPQGLRLSVLQNQNTTSHYNNFAVEHKWELPSVASGSKGESLLALVNSNYLHTVLFHGFSPFQCCWIFECSNSPLCPLFSESLGGRVAKTQMGLKFSQIPLFFPPHFLYKQNCTFSHCYVLIQVNVSPSHIKKALTGHLSMEFGSNHTEFQ